MAQLLEAAGDEPVTDVTDPTAALTDLLAADDTSDTPADEAGDESDADEAELELDDEQDAEPAKAIDAPVSLNADEKTRYAQLPPEAQQFVAELEARRNTQVQQATTKASEAQRTAEARAAQADAQARHTYAEQLSKFADALAPQAPNPANYNDQIQYLTDEAQYRQAKAQHDQFVQQVQTVKQEASQGIDQAFIQERDRALMMIPEVQNEATQPAYFGKVFEAAELLGFDRETVTTKATAQEISMLRAISDMKTKADKYDAAMSKQMQRVRSGKPRTMTPGAAQVRGTSAEGDALAKQFKQNPSRETAAAMIEKYL